METAVHIEKPCMVQWNDMQEQAADKRLCTVCQTIVIDFTNKTPDEIKAFFSDKENQQFCGMYLQKHTNHANKLQKLISRAELYKSKIKFKWPIALLLSSLLFLASCQRKNVRGRKINGYMENSRKSAQHDKRI